MQARRPSAKTFRDLLVWQKAHEFVFEVYRYTESFPQREIYGMVQHMRKAAILASDSWLLSAAFHGFLPAMKFVETRLL